MSWTGATRRDGAARMAYRADNLDVLPFSDTCEDDGNKLPMGDDAPAVTGWASVKAGRWHRIVGGDPADFRTPVATVCGLTITPHNVGESNVNPRNVCGHCGNTP